MMTVPIQPTDSFRPRVVMRVVQTLPDGRRRVLPAQYLDGQWHYIAEDDDDRVPLEPQPSHLVMGGPTR
jgi:hypothetical protein